MQQTSRVIFNVLSQVCKGRILLIPLFVPFRQSVIQFVLSVSEYSRKRSDRPLGVFKRFQRMRKQRAIFGCKERTGIQNATGRLLHRQKRFFRLLFEDLAAQALQAKHFRLNLLRQGLQPLVQPVLFLQQRLPAAVQLLLLLRQAALVTNHLELASAVIVLRNLV